MARRVLLTLAALALSLTSVLAIAPAANAAVGGCVSGAALRPATPKTNAVSGTNAGTIRSSACSYPGRKLSNVDVNFTRTAAGSVSIRFGWQQSNSSGAGTGPVMWDQGATTIVSGQTKGFGWSYSAPNGYPWGANCLVAIVQFGGFSNVFGSPIC